MSVSETAAAMATSYTPEGYGAIRGGCQQSAAAVVHPAIFTDMREMLSR